MALNDDSSSYAGYKETVEKLLGEIKDELFRLDSYTQTDKAIRQLSEILSDMTDYAAEHGLIPENTNVYRECKADTQYGKIDITINLSKPEKDPRDIARAATQFCMIDKNDRLDVCRC